MSMKVPFEMWQEVYHPTTRIGDCERRWFVTGIKAKFGYDFLGWDVSITQALYGDYEPKYFFHRCDVTTISVRDDQLVTPAEFLASERERKTKEIERLEEQLQKLKEEEAKFVAAPRYEWVEKVEDPNKE